MSQFCQHIETGAKGILKDRMDFYNPPQFGIYWIEWANHGKFGNHYYWNDQSKIHILKEKEKPWKEIMNKCPERFYAFYEIFGWLKENYKMPRLMKKKHTYTRKLLGDWLSDQTNRHPRQTLFLLDLLDGDLRKLVLLEMQLKNCFCFYCPGDMEEVNKVLAMEPRTDLLTLKLSIYA